LKHQWYGDHRDVVKWGALLQLAAAHSLRAIIQIAFLTSDDASVVLSSELGEASLDPRVLHHFRNVERISELCGTSALRVHVFAQPFAARSRVAYVRAAIEAIGAIADRPLAVLLDPDTGIAERLASSKHVKDTEVWEFWSALQPSDWLVLYQHAARQPDWLESRRAAFANALGAPKVLTFRAVNGARDVVFFAARRGTSA
jgi:hypothetical protein